NRVDDEARFAERLAACDAQSEIVIERLRRRGQLVEAEAALRRLVAITTDRVSATADLAAVRLARGDARGAASELAALLTTVPRDTTLRLRLADAWLAAGEPVRARATVAEALRLYPGRADVRQAARLLGVAL